MDDASRRTVPTKPQLPPLPATHTDDTAVVRRIATHVLARARWQAVGRFGLIPTPGGIGTPAFGPDATVIRLTGGALLVERAGDVTVTPLDGTTLRTLVDAAGADLAADLDVGADTPPVGDADEMIAVDPTSIAVIGAWQALGWAALDTVVADLGPRPTSRSPARAR